MELIVKKIALIIGDNVKSHLTSLQVLADRLKNEHNFRTIFILPDQSNSQHSIREHGHELFMIDRNNSVNLSYYSKEAINLSDTQITSSTIDRRIFQENLEKVISKLDPDLIISVDTWSLPSYITNLEHIPLIYLCDSNPASFLSPIVENEVSPSSKRIGLKLWNKTRRNNIIRRHCEAKWCKIQERRNKQKLGENFSKFNQQSYYENVINSLELETAFGHSRSQFKSLAEKKSNQEESRYWSEKLNEAMKGKDAMIYFSLGTLASSNVSLMKRYIEMLSADTKRLYVICKGVGGDKFNLHKENMIGANQLPQTFFLKRANLAIIYGGNRSIVDCLYYGVPMIVLPSFADHQKNAQRIDDLDLGRKLNLHKINRDELLETVDQILLDKPSLQRLKTISRNIQGRKDLPKINLNFLLKKLDEERQLTCEEFIENNFRNRHFLGIKV